MADLETGLAAFQRRDFDTAIAHLEKACRENPAEYKAHMYLGAALGEVSRGAEAIAALTKSVEIEPANSQARYNLATAMERAGYKEQAVQVYEQALMLQPDYPAAAEAVARLRAPAPTPPQAMQPSQIQPPSQYAPQPSQAPSLYAPESPPERSLNAPAANYGAGPAPAPPRYTPAPARPVQSERSGNSDRSGGGSAVGMIVLVLILAAAGFGGWYYWMHRTNPKAQALAVYRALVTQDYKSAYTLIKLSDESAKQYPDSAAFEADCQKANDAAARTSPLIKMVLDNVKTGAQTAKAGEPVITGDKAEVPTSMQVTIFGQTLSFAGKAHMVNDGGIWKLDMSTAHSADEIRRTAQDLVGKPNGLGRVK